jgi:hypothetical protein
MEGASNQSIGARQLGDPYKSEPEDGPSDQGISEQVLQSD